MAVSRAKSVLSFCRVSRAKSGFGALGQKSAPRSTKSTTFAKGYFQPFSLLKFFLNPVGEPSVLPIQPPIYRWDQAEVWEYFGIRGWFAMIRGCFWHLRYHCNYLSFPPLSILQLHLFISSNYLFKYFFKYFLTYLLTYLLKYLSNYLSKYILKCLL